MIVIFGATGNTGGEAARQLLAQRHAIRVVGRNLAKLRPLLDKGAEALEADLQNAGDVKRAFEGADVAYLLIPPNFVTPDFRKYQQAITANLGAAVEASHCRKVVMLSSMGAEHPTGTGPIVGLYELEQRLKRIANLDVLAIRAGYFMENLLGNVGMVQTMGILGAPAPAQAPMTLTAAADIGRYAAPRLAARDFQGFEVVNLMGPALVTFDEVTKTIGAAIGKPQLPFVQFSYEDAKKGMLSAGIPEQMASLYIEMYQGAAQGLLRPEAGTPLVHATTSFADFANVFTQAYRAATAA
jgi:uncharacterized protein YbjT (DUF2867 family)